MQPIGGYFSLELPWHEEYHKEALRLNTGRNSLQYILRAQGYRKVYIPYYTCEVILEPFQKTGTGYAFYQIDFDFELAEEVCLQDGEAILYTNYFGLKQRYVERLAEKYGSQLIVDNTQAFYAQPVCGIDTFYTCRKFFGVPDGAYLYTDKLLDVELEQDISYDRMTFLTKRIDLGAEAGYADFREESHGLVGQPIKRMSKLTERLMLSINYQAVAIRRRENYHQLHQELKKSNLLPFPLEDDVVPMAYPYLTEQEGLREHLIANKIYVAKYWPNVLEWAENKRIENKLTSSLVPLPIDQRYGNEEMKYIISKIQET